MNVYTVNVFLAVTLAFWLGYWLGAKRTTSYYQGYVMPRVIAAFNLKVGDEKAKVTSDLNIH